jgi:D-arginine dehydrogenase
MKQYDIAIVGAGMAGASLAAEIGAGASVLLLEAEDRPGYHSTGRSAAFWDETYGGPVVQPLTTASGAFLSSPPSTFSGQGFLSPRGSIHLAAPEDFARLDSFAETFQAQGVVLETIDREVLSARIPGLRAGNWRALSEPGTRDIDVAALHDAYLRAARRAGVELRCAASLQGAHRENGYWTLEIASTPPVRATVLVDAAGAWADTVAVMAGVAPLGISPFRRTLSQLRIDREVPVDMPLVIDVGERFYFKPEAGGRIWLSPHDETPEAPGDSAPHELDIATAIDRLSGVVDWRIERVERSWAGLRSFAPDRVPVYGFAKDAPGFFWFAGQGGFGIQTAPAAAMIGAALLTGSALPLAVGAFDPDRYSPLRFG